MIVGSSSLSPSFPRENQAARYWRTVTARSGARIVLPRGTDPIAWLLKDVYAEHLEGMPLETPLFESLRRPVGLVPVPKDTHFAWGKDD